MLLQPVSRNAASASRRTAFTLLEVLIVVAIIVILAGVGGVYVWQSYDEAKTGIAQTNAQTLATACENFKVRYDRFPETLQELISPPGGGQPMVAPDKLLDPWDKPFQYDPNGPNNNGLKPDVFTTTPSGEQVGNWKRAK